MNTKHNKLTIQELKDFKKKKSRLIFDIVEKYQKYFNKKVEDISILDYGCGRGRITILLKQLGYNFYGVDASYDTINKSDDICMELGFNHNEIFKVVKENNNYEIPFNDGYFDIIITEHLLEHVENIDFLIKDFNRVTNKNSIIFNTLPGKYSLVEPHLKMPFINLNKNLGKLLIPFFVKLKIEPKWIELNNKDTDEKISRYLKYYNNSLFFRSYSFYKKLFKQHNLHTVITLGENEKVKKGKILKLIPNFIMVILTDIYLMQFISYRENIDIRDFLK